MAIVRWTQKGNTAAIRVEPGTRLMDALRQGDYYLSAPCGGGGRCGKCRVVVTGEVSEPTPSELSHLGAELCARHVRLACEVRVEGDCEVLGRDLPLGRSRVSCMDEGGDLGLAVDVGTTTLDARLVTLPEGKVLAEGSMPNPQSAFGADIISRITSVQEHSDHLASMTRLIHQGIRELAQLLCRDCGAQSERIVSCVVAGNTVMTHILWQADPVPLGKMPFTPAFLDARTGKASDWDLPFAENCEVVTLPCISAFLGGDVTAGLLVCPMGRDEKVLLVDIGTNGEMVYHAHGGRRGCAAAAGPALEGGGISCGCSAIPGAIRHVTGDDHGFSVETVAHGEPVGLCGSGIVDAAALLAELEILDPSGFLDEPLQEAWKDVVTGEDGSRTFRLAPGVELTQRDIRELQLTKAAIAAGISALCGEEIPDTVYLCGGLGAAIDPRSACRIDLLPEGFLDRIVPAGNTSLLGAQCILLHPQKLQEARQLASSVTALNLAETAGFQEVFAEHMAFGEL